MISLIIPTLNEAAHIGVLLRQTIANAPPDLADILVADGGSTDGTREIVAEVSASDPRVRLIDNPKRLQAAGVNLAAAAADPRAEILIRLDAHADYPHDYVGRLASILAEREADGVVVRLLTRGEGCFQKAVAAVSNSALGTGGAAHRIGGASRWIDHGHHAAFRRASFLAIGGYDEGFAANEDAEFDVRLRRAGGRIWFAAEVEVGYHPRRSPAALLRQYFRYGGGRAKNLLKNGERLRLRQIAPPVLLGVLLASVLLSPLEPWTLIAPAAYVTAVTLAGAGFALAGRDPCLLGAALALPIMHLSWAAGFLSMLARGGARGLERSDRPRPAPDDQGRPSAGAAGPGPRALVPGAAEREPCSPLRHVE